MSRCFPYPPPGYIPRSTVDGALIESIKLQRESKKSKEERHQKKAKKDKKREKKEKKEKKKKKEEKVKSKHVASVTGELIDKKGQTGEVGLVKLKDGLSQRITKDEAEQLEKSDLTEEYGQAVNSQNSCHSSDSTENSGKRKRDTSVSGDASLSSGNSNHGNIIRLRLPLPKPKESEVSVAKEQKGSERLPPAKNYGPEVSLGIGQSSSMRPALLKHKEPEASVGEEQSSVSLQHLKGKEPEASPCKEQNSFMRLPLQKHKGSMPSVSKEQSSSVRMPFQKQEGHVASVSQEQSSSMRLPLRNHRETEALAIEEQSNSMRLPHLKRKEPEASPRKEWSASMELPCLKRQKPDASSNKEGSSPVSKRKESETSRPPLPKQWEPEASRRGESCSTSGRVDFIAHQKWVMPGQTIEAQPISPRPDPRLPCSTLKVPEIVLQKDDKVENGSSFSSSKSRRRQRAESQYKALVEDWIPPLLQVELTDSCDDQEWLFQKHGERQESKLAHQETVNCQCSTSWPRAQYIHSADVYALPFTVPF